jgi:hypothetical protein
MAKNAFGIQIENGRLTHQVHGSKQLRAKDKFNDRTVVVSGKWQAPSAISNGRFRIPNAGQSETRK